MSFQGLHAFAIDLLTSSHCFCYDNKITITQDILHCVNLNVLFRTLTVPIQTNFKGQIKISTGQDTSTNITENGEYIKKNSFHLPLYCLCCPLVTLLCAHLLPIHRATRLRMFLGSKSVRSSSQMNTETSSQRRSVDSRFSFFFST